MEEDREGATGAGMRAGAVYAMTNAAAGNEVVAFHRADDGTLALMGSYPTGGRGTGPRNVSPAGPQTGIDPLTSQGSLSLSRDGRFLFAVNAGSDSISCFHVDIGGVLRLADVENSGGFQPNSLSEYGGLLYVANVGNTANGFSSNVTGFRVAGGGRLVMIPGSARPLSTADAQPACVVFSPMGSLLVVTELTAGRISFFHVGEGGFLTGPTAYRSHGGMPFGAAFLSTGCLLVAETSGALSSYIAYDEVRLAVLSGSVQNGQEATCWVAPSRDERFAYTSNAGSGTISSYRVRPDGTLALAEATAALEGTGSGPIDNGVSLDGRYFYVLNGGNGSVAAYRIGKDGRLALLQIVSDQGLPDLGAQGLAVR